MVHFLGLLTQPMDSAERDCLKARRVPIDIAVNGCLHLTDAFRSLPRPSSPTRAKASTVCP